ncbi:hypothetical protein ABZS83_21280 [Streptomyces sp. NPDC005426]|uniref:hypothetical protein n=1 Tax=Streptomyces sp. NPDC005426 TaxID=3155344 RepID=UPI00339EE835
MTSIDKLIAQYATDVAFVAEREPATTLADFTQQLATAADLLGPSWVDIEGAEELDTAVVYLTDALDSTDDAERAVLVSRAARYLVDVDDIVSEYRLSV